MKKKLILSLVVILAVIGLTSCGIQVDPNRALTPENASGFWETILVLPLVQLITWFNNLFNNLGVAIIVVTVLTRLAMMPLMLKSMNSTAKMQAIKPEMDKIQKKYAGNTDRETQMKMNMELQKLYKENSVNPLAGCLPMLVQMPLMIAFFQAFTRHPLLAFGAEGSYFLGMNLASVQELPNIVFAALVAGLMYVSQTMMQKRTQPTTGADAPAGALNPKMMNAMFLPLMAATVFFSPLAMGLYFLVGQIMMNIQSFIIKKPGIAPF